MKIGLLFPDYGSQYVGMGKELYDTSRLMQEHFEQASNCLNINFVKLCFASSDLELARIDHAYPALFLISASIAAIAKEHGINACAVAGYGIGEYAALYGAGSLSFPDGLYFLTKYAQLYQHLLDKRSLSMARAIGLDGNTIATWCASHSTQESMVSIAAYHSDNDVVIAGDKKAVRSLVDQVLESGGIIMEAPVEAGVHSPIMQSVADGLFMYAEKIDITDARVPLISCVDGVVRTAGDALGHAVLQQTIEPIRWDRVMTHIGAWDIIVEIGPGSTLGKLIQTIWPDKKVYTINRLQDIEDLLG